MSARAERWAWQVIDTVDLPPPERMVLLVLARKHTDAGGCFPSQETIAHLSGFRRRKVCDLLASLEAAGLIRRETTRTAGRFQKTRYHLFGKAHRAQTGAHGTVRKKKRTVDPAHRAPPSAQNRGNTIPKGGTGGNVVPFAEKSAPDADPPAPTETRRRSSTE